MSRDEEMSVSDTGWVDGLVAEPKCTAETGLQDLC